MANNSGDKLKMRNGMYRRSMLSELPLFADAHYVRQIDAAERDLGTLTNGQRVDLLLDNNNSLTLAQAKQIVASLEQNLQTKG